LSFIIRHKRSSANVISAEKKDLRNPLNLILPSRCGRRLASAICVQWPPSNVSNVRG